MQQNNNKHKKIKRIILDFEDGKVDIQQTLKLINDITIKRITKDDILEYWSYTSLDELIEILLIDPIEDWRDIDDDKALYLIDEIINNISNDVILERNSEVLEKRYGKPTGTVIDLICSEAEDDSKFILKKLKINDIIQL